MADVLAVCMRPHDPDCPLVCLDETSKQLLAETRVPIPMKVGRRNLFMMFALLEGWLHVKVTERHTAADYAHVLKELADIRFPRARDIVLVQDNLNIHNKSSLYEAFPPPRPGAWSNASSCIPRRSTAAGLIRRSLNSASYRPSALIGAFPTSKPHRRGRHLGAGAKCQSNSGIYILQSD